MAQQEVQWGFREDYEMAKCTHHVGIRGALKFETNWVTPSTFPQIPASGWDMAVFSNGYHQAQEYDV